MFLSKSDEETTSNRKLAKDLVDKWVISHALHLGLCLSYNFLLFLKV